MIARFYFEPLWFGVRVESGPKNRDGVSVLTRIWIGIVPCFPLHIAWWNV